MVRPVHGGALVAACLLVTIIATSGFAGQAPEGKGAVPAAEAPFLAENDAAMTRMMDGMAPKPTGDVNRDFVEMMIPHHQGAIDMAQAYLRYGSNEQLRRIAQEIIVEQQQEIAAMRLALGDPLPASAPSPTQVEPQPSPQSSPSASAAMPAMDPNMKMGH
jgi:hypothetical protein